MLLAQKKQTKHLPSPKSSSSHLYDSLLAQVRSGDTTIDFESLRMAYTETSDYSPYGDESEEGAIFAAIDSGQWNLALERAANVLKTNYVSITAHIGAELAYRNLEASDSAKLHHTIVYKLAMSILNSGDGTSPESAWKVIRVSEEYTVLQMLGKRVGSQALVRSSDGHPVDKMSVTDRETGEETTYYFDVSLPMGHLDRELRGK
jgi:hypothetical protein